MMRKKWFELLRSAEDGTGSGGDAGGVGDGGNMGSGGQDGAAPSGDQQQQSPGSILDLATKPGSQQPGGEPWKPPEGVTIPAHLLGTTADETIQKLNAAYAGARKAIGTGKQDGTAMQGEVPADLSKYAASWEPVGDNDPIAAELSNEASKPMVDAFRAAAHKNGIPERVFQQMMRDGLTGISEQGIPIGKSEQELSDISGDAELEKLSKTYGPAEAGTMINTVVSYADKLHSRGILNAEELKEWRVMCGTADSVAIMHKVLVGELGEKPIPRSDALEGAMSPVEAQASYSAALSMSAGPERDSAIARASKAMQDAFGSSSSGSIRSSVL